jgi:hypothetical protein
MYFAIDLKINNRDFLYTNIRLVFCQHTFFLSIFKHHSIHAHTINTFYMLFFGI